ncbi:hypothetical protein ACWFNE_06880 [Cellulomonas sp. NPDC055163]
MSPDTIPTAVGPADVFHRLALGVRVLDGVTTLGAPWPLHVGWEAPARVLPRGRPSWWPCVDLLPSGGGRFRLNAGRTVVPTTLVLRVYDPSRRYVPRRLSLTPWSWSQLTQQGHDVDVRARTITPWLAPAAAYPLPVGSTSVRGRVTRGAVALPYARVRAVAPGTNAVLGRAHADDRGEFTLLLRSTAQNPVMSTVTVDLVVYGPVAAPSAPDDLPRRTRGPDGPLFDPPVEPLQRPSDPPLPAELDTPRLRGELAPPGYVLSTAPVLNRQLDVGRQTVLTDVPFAP